MDEQRHVLDSAAIEAMEEQEFHHPLNPESHAWYRSLSDALSFERIGFHQVRVPPGKEANEYHTHRFEEEFYYVLSGRGVVLIDGEEHEVGPGDFIGFPSPSPPHIMTNPFDEDVVYLVGGERREFEIAEFPRHEKVLIRERQNVWIATLEDLEVPALDDGGDDEQAS